jgi:hypothetical protein
VARPDQPYAAALQLYMQHLFNKHSGEVAISHFEWVPFDGVLEQRLFHPQYATTLGARRVFSTAHCDHAAAGAPMDLALARPTTWMERIPDSRWRFRRAKCFTLQELFNVGKTRFTACELYFYYSHAAKVALKRDHPTANQDRRDAAVLRHKETSFWGFGR